MRASARLLAAIQGAQSGLKSKVTEFMEALTDAVLYIPLAEDMPDTPDGEQIEFEGELTFRPHMILGEDETIFAVTYSDPALVDHMREALGWDTSGQELKFICAPAHVALDLSQIAIEGTEVAGLVFNPGTEDELVLRRDEVASLIAKQPIPLVGYVEELTPEEEVTVVEGAAPPPQALMDALLRAKSDIKDLVQVNVQTTFDPERDREPHLCITLTVIGRHDLNRKLIADQVMDYAADLLPQPGYADIIFRDAPN